jgi:hypothetical protein
VVLLIPGLTRSWLLENVWQNLAFLIGTSVFVALTCRNFIAGAETLGDHLVRAVVVPYLGCLVFLTLWTVLIWAQSLLFGDLANVHDTLSLYLMGTMASALSFFVVIPYGLFCQHVMSATAPPRGFG